MNRWVGRSARWLEPNPDAMVTNELPADTRRPMTAGLDLAINSVIDLQNRLAEMRARSTSSS